ncbi:hypothetical protein ACH5RR_001081 [Cinchona calisaya]|uniref:Uncharacterized protein n=1 Tax=Cinchona calisaya TaxID=153742 RepID=A0ABD3B2F6_9GENT
MDSISDFLFVNPYLIGSDINVTATEDEYVGSSVLDRGSMAEFVEAQSLCGLKEIHSQEVNSRGIISRMLFPYGKAPNQILQHVSRLITNEEQSYLFSEVSMVELH